MVNNVSATTPGGPSSFRIRQHFVRKQDESSRSRTLHALCLHHRGIKVLPLQRFHVSCKKLRSLLLMSFLPVRRCFELPVKRWSCNSAAEEPLPQVGAFLVVGRFDRRPGAYLKTPNGGPGPLLKEMRIPIESVPSWAYTGFQPGSSYSEMQTIPLTWKKWGSLQAS